MNYNWTAIGKRIMHERKQLGLTQEDLIKEIGLSAESRQLIGRWEKGKSYPTIDDLKKLCNVFNCELGYLLCEYDCKTRETADIHSITGLSEKAIDALSKMNSNKNAHILNLNQILEHKEFLSLLDAIEAYKVTVSLNRLRPEVNEATQQLARLFNCRPSQVGIYLESQSISVVELTIMKIVKDIKWVNQNGNNSKA